MPPGALNSASRAAAVACVGWASVTRPTRMEKPKGHSAACAQRLRTSQSSRRVGRRQSSSVRPWPMAAQADQSASRTGEAILGRHRPTLSARQTAAAVLGGGLRSASRAGLSGRASAGRGASRGRRRRAAAARGSGPAACRRRPAPPAGRAARPGSSGCRGRTPGAGSCARSRRRSSGVGEAVRVAVGRQQPMITTVAGRDRLRRRSPGPRWRSGRWPSRTGPSKRRNSSIAPGSSAGSARSRSHWSRLAQQQEGRRCRSG